MQMISDILLGAGALGAGLFCYVLARRLAAFTTLETGMGGAIAVLSAQVDDMTRALQSAQDASVNSSGRLAELTERAEDSARRLELILASLHDLPDGDAAPARRQRVQHSRTRVRTERAA